MKNAIKTTLLFCLSLLFCIVIAEIVVRIVFPVSGQLYEFDEHYLHRLIPDNQEIYYDRKEQGGGAVRVRVNKQGFRGGISLLNRVSVSLYMEIPSLKRNLQLRSIPSLSVWSIIFEREVLKYRFLMQVLVDMAPTRRI